MKVTNRAQLYADAIKFAAGTATHGPSFPTLLTVVTAPDLLSLLGTSRGIDQLFQDGKAERRLAFQGQKNCKEPSQLWIGKAHDVLVPFLGRTWNEGWAQAGWIAAGSTATPDALPQILDLLNRLHRFLGKNPRFENAEPEANVTAARAKRMHDDLDLCIKGVSTAKTKQRTLRETRETADTDLMTMLQAGRKVLEIQMKPEDPRWLDFIEQVPADLERPEAPEDVEVEGGLPGRVTLRCEPSERAESYVAEAQVEGQDEKFRTVATMQDPVVNLTFPPGSKVKLRLLARNSTGLSAPSEVVEAVVPALTETQPVPKVQAA